MGEEDGPEWAPRPCEEALGLASVIYIMLYCGPIEYRVKVAASLQAILKEVVSVRENNSDVVHQPERAEF